MRLSPFGYMSVLNGLKEVEDKKTIMAFLAKNSKDGDIAIDPSKTPWCAATINACLRAAGYPGNGKLNARSFLTYGTCVYDAKTHTGKVTDGKTGDIIIFDFEHDGIHGHVSFIDTPKVGGYLCMGGNQDNQVCQKFYGLGSVIGIRRKI